MTHYAHTHRIALPARSGVLCEPCDCYVHRTGMHRRYVGYRSLVIELIMELIETQLSRPPHETAIMAVWNEATEWQGRSTGPPPDPTGLLWKSPSLAAAIRGVFESLDQHGVLEPARYDSAGRRALAWRKVDDGKSS
jgi:hypothetical protein